MATKNAETTDPANVEWETINTSIGTEWDFEHDGPLVGHFIGTQVVATEKVESGEATAIQFAPLDSPDDTVFVWQSEALKTFTDPESLIRVGDLVRLTYLGRDSFKAADGSPRQMKRYKIEAQTRR